MERLFRPENSVGIAVSRQQHEFPRQPLERGPKLLIQTLRQRWRHPRRHDFSRGNQRQRPPADILKLNAWLKEYAAKTGAVYADYYAAFADEKGWLRDGFSGDGLHPNAKGYELMAPIAEAAIKKALGR